MIYVIYTCINIFYLWLGFTSHQHSIGYMVTSQQRPQSVAFLDSVLSDLAHYMKKAKPQREFDLRLIVTVK
jgi:hypothetical protein